MSEFRYVLSLPFPEQKIALIVITFFFFLHSVLCLNHSCPFTAPTILNESPLGLFLTLLTGLSGGHEAVAAYLP